jgi:hypothetical protein
MLGYDQTQIKELYAQQVLYHEPCIEQLGEWRRRAATD